MEVTFSAFKLLLFIGVLSMGRKDDMEIAAFLILIMKTENGI